MRLLFIILFHVGNSILSSNESTWGWRTYGCIHLVDTDEEGYYYVPPSLNSTGPLSLAPDSHTAERLFLNDRNCPSFHSSELQGIQFGPSLPSLIPQVDTPDEYIRVDILRMKLLHVNIISASQQFGGYLNPALIPYPCMPNKSCLLMACRDLQTANGLLKWLTLDPGADPAKEDSSSLYRFNFSDQLIKGEDMTILLIPSLNDSTRRARPPFGDLFIFYTVDVSLMPYIGFYHMARIILDETTGLLSVEPRIHLEVTPSVADPPPGLEKNWAPFIYENSLHFIYSFYPFHVIRPPSFNSSVTKVVMEDVSKVHCQNDGAEPAAPETPSSPVHYNIHHRHHKQDPWIHGELRGGTPALLIYHGGEYFYLTFFHSVGRVHQAYRRNTYFMGAQTFTSSSPFTPIAISKAPIFLDQFYEGKWNHDTLDYIVFPMSFFLSESMDASDAPMDLIPGEVYESTSKTVIHLSLGRQNEEAWLFQIYLHDLLGSLKPYTLPPCNP